MSYVTQEATWGQKQSSIGGALLINGLIIAGLALTNHVVKPNEDEVRTTFIDIKDKKEPPLEPVIIDPEPAKLPPISAPTPITPIPPSNIFVESTPEAITAPIITAGTASGSGDVPIPTPPNIADPIIADPVIIGARRDPKYARNFQPEYPGALLRQDIEGKVKLRFLIGSDGRVKSVEILSASHPKFAKAAEKQALRKWRFIPATHDGVDIDEWQTITISFTIN